MKKNLLISMLIAVFALGSFLVAMPDASAWRTSSLELARQKKIRDENANVARHYIDPNLGSCTDYPPIPRERGWCTICYKDGRETYNSCKNWH